MLQVEIDGQWAAKDFMAFYESVHALYSAFAVVSIEQGSEQELERFYQDFHDFYSPSHPLSRRLRFFLRAQRGFAGSGAPIPPSQFLDADETLETHERLVVRRCEYASPGVTDLAGIGQVLGHVKDILLKCIEVCTSRRERRLKNEILAHECDAKALQNVAERLNILKSLGCSDSHCRQIIAVLSPAVVKLEALAARGLQKHAENVENDSQSERRADPQRRGTVVRFVITWCAAVAVHA